MYEKKILWEPGEEFRNKSNLHSFIQWLRSKGINKTTYPELHRWSVDNLEYFWSSLLEYFNVQYNGTFSQALEGAMPNVKWFDGISLSYSEHIFRNHTQAHPAIIFSSETKEVEELSWDTLTQRVSGLQQYFKSIGLKQNDRVVAYLPNIPEATISFLAANSIGAVWSSCSPDFGKQAVLDRFVQIEPKVLVVTDGYWYGGKYFDKSETAKEIISSLPTLEKVIIVPSKGDVPVSKEFTSWHEIKPSPDKIEFTRVPFDHPIWILFSSGTTGMPKAITHGTGGILLEQIKYATFHQDVKKGERCFWFTTTGWMMWNYIHGSLLTGGTMVLYDGHPAHPYRGKLWKLIDGCSIHHFGISGSYIVSMMKSDINPKDEFNLTSLRSIGSTGSPLPPEGFQWVYENVKKNVWLTSMSGGTDVCSAFVGGCPLLPVHEGEIQCIALGCDLQVWDESGHPLQNEEGELVITKPMPSMPVYFWNDPDFIKYKESYFEMFEGAWRHGDWIKQTPSGGLIIYGRSDATLNRGGVRIGSAEIYKTLDKIPQIKDSLIVCIDKSDGEFYMPLFVVLNDKVDLDETLIKAIKHKLKTECSPRHVPDEILACPDIPYTLSGKKTETPIKKILMGKDPEKAVNKGSLRNPESINFFNNFYKNQRG